MTGATDLAGFQPLTTRDFAAVRAAQPDYRAWLDHIGPAAACARPIRLAGDLYTVRGTSDGGVQVLDHTTTAAMPDGAIYKACGNRRASLCPACARTYQRDAYQILRSFLIGGKGVPATVAHHPAVFATFTAPSFGTVHGRVVRKHTCTTRRACDCRPEPCHARSTGPGLCTHGNPAVCWARHETGDAVLGRPLCLDCYDHDHQVVWNHFTGELWRRTKQTADRLLHKLAKQRGIPDVMVQSPTTLKWRAVSPVRIAHGKAAEFQARGAVHFHALIRLDGIDPDDPTAAVPPPPGFTSLDLDDVIHQAATRERVTTPTHPDMPDGWRLVWGEQLDVRHITLDGTADITDGMAAGYLAKYATKSTEATGHRSTRLTTDTIDVYADPDGGHTARLIDACWRLGRPTHTPQPLSTRDTYVSNTQRRNPAWTPHACPDCGHTTRLTYCPSCTPECQPDLDTEPATERPANPYKGLRRWAHMLGYGGHFLTKGRRGCPTFGLLRAARIDFTRGQHTNSPTAVVRTVDHLDEETTLTVGLLTYAGAGWHNVGDALLANTAADMARHRREVAREELAHEIGSDRTPHLIAA